MNNTNGFHSSSLSITDNEINDTTKRVLNPNDKTRKSKTIHETRSMKGFNKKSKSIDVKKKTLEHNDSNNNNDNSTKKLKHYSHTNLEHIPSTSSEQLINNYCNSCGECYGDMISCDRCSARFHVHCINLNEEISKGSYLCENCRIITKTQDKIILPFTFDPKKNLHLNGFKKNQSTSGQIKLSTASNGQSLIQPSGEIKFRASSNKNSSSSNLKRKRIDSSSPPPSATTTNPLNTQLEALNYLFISCPAGEFHGPSILSDNQIEKYCFICRKSSIKQGPSLQCDYCPLTYHLDCLTPPMTSLPLSNEKWMCPNHMTPLLDRYLLKNSTYPTSNRMKLYHQYSQIEENIIIQDFQSIKQTHINTSQIPKFIEEFYLKSNNIKQESISNITIKDQPEENLSHYESSSAYDPSIWDILQSILNHIVNDSPYEFSSNIIKNDYIEKSPLKLEQSNTLDTLLHVLNEPNSSSEQCTRNQINSFSDLIDLSQFHLSHAALIHLRSQNVIYIRKHVVWFGLSSLNDICLENFILSYSCPNITERHACLYYDQKRNLFELLNYSEYGTIVNNLRYGLGMINDDEKNLEKCFCSTKSLCHSNWDGPAQIEQGTVIKIGCHEFLFYRHIVR